jgi:predicted transcriptional regulator
VLRSIMAKSNSRIAILLALAAFFPDGATFSQLEECLNIKRYDFEYGLKALQNERLITGKGHGCIYQLAGL